MRRRSFISRLPLVSGLAAGGIHAADSYAQPTMDTADIVTEPARDIPVIETTDVLVVGGGPAGVAAAIAASRTGASTILVERYNHLGGLWTGGLVLPLLSTHGLLENGRFEKVIYGIGDEIAQRLHGMGMAINEVNPVIDPEAAKYVLEVMIQDAGVRMLYHCRASNVIVEDGVITAVILETKSGRVAIRPKVVIDCTGDGDIFHLAGERYDIMNYNIGLVHRLGNIDRIDKTKPGYKEQPVGNPTPLHGVNWVNMYGETHYNGIDLYTLSELQQQFRIEIWEATEEIRETPGYEEVFLLDTASQLGVRMSRILRGAYRLTFDDSMTYRTFDDVIGISGAWTSVQYNGERITFRNRPSWQIPYRTLLPQQTKNLLVAGRCFSFEQRLVEDARIIGTCLVTGHGAGVAAARAVKANIAVQEVDVASVQSVLGKQNAYLG